MARRYAKSDGCYVECGVAAGAQIIAMAYGAPDKTIWAFDSFEGIPLPSNKDDQMPGIRNLSRTERKALPLPGQQMLKSSGATVYSIGQFWDNIMKSGLKPNNIVAAKGWFEEVVPKAETGPIAILRLDGDLYNSTLVCLQHLFPKVIDGGLIIIDDWHLPGCRLAVKNYFTNGIPYSINITPDIAYFTKS
jgi:hypothetical protein